MPEAEPPVWNDPLLPGPRPTASGSGAYVEQPEPRANPMTGEGEIAAIGQMARGAVRQPGRRGQVARVFIVLALVAFASGAVLQLVSLFR